MLDAKPEPDKISFRMPLIPSRSRDFAPKGEPLAHVEIRRINPCKQVGKVTVQTLRQYD